MTTAAHGGPGPDRPRRGADRPYFDSSATARAGSVLCADGTEREIPPHRWRFLIYSAIGP